MKVPNFIKYAVVAVLAIAVYQFITLPVAKSKEELKNQDPQAFLKSLAKEVILIKVRNEPKVIEAMLTDAKVLYVSVRDDGTRRTGYAAYLCMIAKSDFVERVKVIEGQ